MSFNKVIIQGNISQEIELKQTTSGTSVCTFNVAVNRISKEPNEAKCDFFTVVAWSAKAEFVSRYFKKGQPILICGRLENRDWTDKNGNKRISTEIIAEEISFCGNAEKQDKPSAPQSPATHSGNKGYMPDAYAAPMQFEPIPQDESLPF